MATASLLEWLEKVQIMVSSLWDYRGEKTGGLRRRKLIIIDLA